MTFEKQELMNVSWEILGAPELKYLYANFTWTPSNSARNAILAIVCSFEYKATQPPTTNWRLEYDINVGSVFPYYQYLDYGVPNYGLREEWNLLTFKTIPGYEPTKDWIDPNQATYPIKLLLRAWSAELTYVGNVNLMLLVVDG